MSNLEREFAGCSRDVFHMNHEVEDEPFCTQDNWQNAVLFLNQELQLCGWDPICCDGNGNGQLDVVSLLNVAWAVLQNNKEKMKKITDLESQIRRNNTDIEQMHCNSMKLKDLLDFKDKQINEIDSKERQALLANQQIQLELKLSKEETKRFSSMLLHRESRFSHDTKKKDQEIFKLKERLLKVISETKNGAKNHVSIDIIGNLPEKIDGKGRSRWKNESEDQKRSDELLQKVIASSQDKQNQLSLELNESKNTIDKMLKEVQALNIDDHQIEIQSFLNDMPRDYKSISKEWKRILTQISVSDQHQHNPKKYELKEDQIAVSLGLGSDQYLDNNKIEEKIVLNTFVPLSDVKHSAPPGWVSKSNSTTLPPTGKAETVKLRTLYNSSSSGTSGGQTSEIRPRPRSTNLSPYRNQQSNSNRIGNAITNNVPGKVIRHSSRCGSLSPSSVSPTRGSAIGDSRSLPRMTGSKLSLRRQQQPSSKSQTSSANNSSADESNGPSAAYRKIVGRKSAMSNRAQSPPIRGACVMTSPNLSENETSSPTITNELTQQLKKLGQYLEQKEELQDSAADGNDIDSEVDEYLMSIRKALKKK